MKIPHLLATLLCCLAACSPRPGPSFDAGSGGTDPGDGGAVGPTGGTVDLLRFATVGDTRPPSCDDIAAYPTPIINAIADAVQARQAQFMIDTGDHMYVCTNQLADADAQMALFMSSAARFSNQWFMTMGNHECFGGPCTHQQLGSATNLAFLKALAPISALPYYTFDVATRLGRATFVVLADNAWEQGQADWLERTLTAADAAATYTIITRHHPENDTSVAGNAEAMTIIRRHKFALFLTGHSHLYKHPDTDQGRDMVIGIGGAPLSSSSGFNGYAMVEQQPDAQLRITVYNVVGDVARDVFSVGPNQ